MPCLIFLETRADWQLSSDGGLGTVDEGARRWRRTCELFYCDLTRAFCDVSCETSQMTGWGFSGVSPKMGRRVVHGHDYGHVYYGSDSVRSHEAEKDGSWGSNRLYLCACARGRAKGVVRRRGHDLGSDSGLGLDLDLTERAGDDGLCYRGDGEAREGGILSDPRISRLCQLEPVVLHHRYPRRLSWQYVEVVLVEAVTGARWLRPFEFCIGRSKCPHLSRAAGITEEGWLLSPLRQRPQII